MFGLFQKRQTSAPAIEVSFNNTSPVLQALDVSGADTRKWGGRGWSGTSVGKKTKEYGLIEFLYNETPGARQAVSRIINDVFDKDIIIVKDENYSGDRTTDRRKLEKVYSNKLKKTLKFLLLNYLVYGVGFSKIVRNKLGSPIGLEPMYTNKCSVETNTNAQFPEIEKLRYTMVESKEYTKDKFVHLADWGISNTLIGESPLESNLSFFLLAHLAISRNMSILKKRAGDGLIFVLNDGTKPEQIQNFLASFRSQNDSHNKAGGTLAISDVKEVILDNKQEELSYSQLIDTIQSIVCGLYSVPLTLIAVSENSNRSNSETDRKNYLENRINPLKRDFQDFINSEIVQSVFGIYGWKLKIPETPTVTEKQVAETVRTGIEFGFMTINEAREKIGLSKLTEENADKPMLKIGSGYVHLDNTDELSKAVSGAGTTDTDKSANKEDSNNEGTEDYTPEEKTNLP